MINASGSAGNEVRCVLIGFLNLATKCSRNVT